jgi:hypothetical protein
MNDPILRTIAYADIFDYPLSLPEIQRYLIGEAVSMQDLQEAIQESDHAPFHLTHTGGFWTLRGREELVELRRGRQRESTRLWPAAVHYGLIMAELPFVRMVAVTGALAVNNVAGRLDLDYLVVTQPGRLWLCRAFTILLVHWARLKGVTICPNYFLAENSLSISERNLYTAHELAQMVPLSGLDVYWKMCELNSWMRDYLPNAGGLPQPSKIPVSLVRQGRTSARRTVWRAAEAVLRMPAANWLEGWEMERKIRKFQTGQGDSSEIDFCADWCKGHFEAHGKRTLQAYEERLQRLALSESVTQDAIRVAHMETVP